MRILFLNYEYPPLGGGAGNATAYLLKEFAKIPGLEVDLVTSAIDKKYQLEKIGENIRIHRLPIGKNPKNLHFQSQKDLLIYAWKVVRATLWTSPGRNVCRNVCEGMAFIPRRSVPLGIGILHASSSPALTRFTTPVVMVWKARRSSHPL